MSESIYRTEFQNFSRGPGRKAPDWLAYIRQCSMERFEALGFPTTKNEDWHFTSVGRIAEAAFQPRAEPGGNVSADDLAAFTFGATDWPTIVFVNGVFAPS
jgi:Fe-S cluster assembly protein SufD